MQKACTIPYIVKYGDKDYRAFLPCCIDGIRHTLYSHGTTVDEARAAVENHYRNLENGMNKNVLIKVKNKAWNLKHGALKNNTRPEEALETNV